MRIYLICILVCMLLGVPTLARAQGLPVSFLSKQRVGAICFDTANTNDALDCWLTHHPDVAGAMFYADSVFIGTWPTWPAPVKNQLRVYFNQMVLWYNAGMPSGFPHPFPVPVPAGGTPQVPSPGSAEAFWMTESTGKRVYLSQLGNSLAAELTGAFKWTITTYTPAQLTLLLSMDDTLFYLATVPNPGYFFQYGGPSPAVPGFTVRFFKTNNLLGHDATDTIARLFAWEQNLSHAFVLSGDPTVNTGPYFWGPNTPPVPDSKVIKGMVYGGPMNFGFGHFTSGCSGTQDFMKSVLRSVNIPVQRHWVACAHATPIFPTVDLALTHGDDPYNSLRKISPFPAFSTPAPVEYFISINELNQIFPVAQDWDVCTHFVGIQVVNIAVKYGSDYLMNLYCQDLTSGADHASGQVFDLLKWYYPTVQALESMGLWITLDAKVSATNFCGF